MPEGEKPIIRVYDKYLTAKELSGIVPSGLSLEDSTAIADKYIESWTAKQLKLKKAETNLTDDEKDLTDELDAYRTSMLIYKYEQKFVTDRIDTVIDPKVIEEYYAEYGHDFVLDDAVLLASYIVVPANEQDYYKLKSLFRSDKEKDKELLEVHCQKKNFDFSFSAKWYNARSFINEHSIQVYGSIDQNLKYSNFIEAKDSLYRYLIKIDEYRPVGGKAPLELVDKDISVILLNKRKINLLKEMEKDFYESAEKGGNIEKFIQ